MTDAIDEAAAAAVANDNIYSKLTAARIALRGTKLHKEFELQRKFDAFGIHELVAGTEKCLLGYGIYPLFTVESWSKVEKWFVVFGRGEFVNIARPEDRMIVHGVGEGMDGSDKGAGKATSYMRKNILVQALYLTTGSDNEAEDIQVNAPIRAQHGQAQYAPHPGFTPAAPAPGPGPNQSYTNAQAHGYTLAFDPAQPPQTLAAAQVLQAVTSWLTTLRPGDTASIQAFIANNRGELDRFGNDDEANGRRNVSAVERVLFAAMSKAEEAHAG